MHIRLITPAPPRSRKGNRVTAVEWARLLRGLGHRVTVAEAYAGEPCDVLVALHARRSAPAVAGYRARHPQGPLVVVLTGTDLYGDLPEHPDAQASVAAADRLVVLQEEGVAALPAAVRARTRVIVQAATPVRRLPPRRDAFEVAVVGHLRPVKEPFLAAEAARLLPDDSCIRIVHAGGALEETMAAQAKAEMAANPRYRWLGEWPRWRARRLIARSRLMVLSSRMEGGAHVIGEAATAGVPVLATDIPGNRGLLGADYPGTFPVGDADALAALLRRAERDADFLAALEAGVRRAAPRFAPSQERAAWATLLSELGPA